MDLREVGSGMMSALTVAVAKRLIKDADEDDGGALEFGPLV